MLLLISFYFSSLIDGLSKKGFFLEDLGKTKTGKLTIDDVRYGTVWLS